MPTYKNISSQFIVSKIYRDLGLEDTNYETDIIEWMGEALDFIGASSQLVTKTEELTVTNFRADIPLHLVVFTQVRMKDQDCWKLITFNPASFFGHEPNCANLKVKSKEFYTLNPNYINTSFEEGTLLISYKSLAVDDNGYPLVPDNQYFKEALFWYCFKKMVMRGYVPRSQELNYGIADEKWRFYCSAARNQANYPDIAEYERFMNVWKGLIPDTSFIEREFDDSQTDKIELDVVDASNIVTTPITIDKKEDEDDDSPPTITDDTLTVEEI